MFRRTHADLVVLTEDQQQLLSQLKDELTSPEPAPVLLTGPAGAGRTLLCNQLAGMLGEGVQAVFVPCGAEEDLPYLRSLLVQQLLPGSDPEKALTATVTPEALDEAGIKYGLLQNIDHEGGEATEASVADLLEQGYMQNILQFTSVAGGNPAQEHMQSFQYAYNIQAIFKWLLKQSL